MPAKLGFLTAYIPEELFYAAGLTPVFLFHTPADRGLARAHLPGFTCWIAGSVLDRGLAGELDDLDALALAKSCDTIQGLTDLWQRNLPHIPLFHFGMPLRLDGAIPREYLLAELRSLRERLAAFVGQAIGDDDLRAAIRHYNHRRAQVRRLYGQAPALPPPTLYRAVRAALTAAPLPPVEPDPLPAAPLLVLVGSALGDPTLFDALEQAGGRVAGDLFDLGERYFAVDAAEDGDPLAAIADRLLAAVPTPTKHHPRRSRAVHLLSLVENRRAAGVIFARQKFCDPHGFDYAHLARALDEREVPHLLIELEQASQAGQMLTRVEAFVEMLTALPR